MQRLHELVLRDEEQSQGRGDDYTEPKRSYAELPFQWDGHKNIGALGDMSPAPEMADCRRDTYYHIVDVIGVHEGGVESGLT
jgi:hypothetical protein